MIPRVEHTWRAIDNFNNLEASHSSSLHIQQLNSFIQLKTEAWERNFTKLSNLLTKL